MRNNSFLVSDLFRPIALLYKVLFIFLLSLYWILFFVFIIFIGFRLKGLVSRFLFLRLAIRIIAHFLNVILLRFFIFRGWLFAIRFLSLWNGVWNQLCRCAFLLIFFLSLLFLLFFLHWIYRGNFIRFSLLFYFYYFWDFFAHNWNRLAKL